MADLELLTIKLQRMTIESTNVQLPLQPPLLIADVSGSTSWDEWFKTETTLPDFGTDKIVNSIEITQDIPDIVVDQDAGLCKYQIQGKVQFLQTV